MMKKILTTALVVSMISTISFANGFHFGEGKGSTYFSNEVSSNIIDTWIWDNDEDDSIDSKTKFAGFNDEVIAEYVSDKFSVGMKATFSLLTNKYHNGDKDVLAIDWDKDSTDYYAEIRPFDIVAIGFHDNLYTAGAHLPVCDKDISGGNYGTSGLVALIKPVDGLTISGGVDFRAIFDEFDGDTGDKDDGDPAICFGVDYTEEKFSVGAALRHISSNANRQIGVYASVKAIENFVLNAGFTYSKNGDVGLGDVDYANSYVYFDKEDNTWHNFDGVNGIYGENVVNFGLTYDVSPINVGMDLAFNFDNDDSFYDLYFALDGAFDFEQIEGLGFDIQGFILYDLGTGDDYKEGATLGVKPKITYKLNNKHSFDVGIALQHKLEGDSKVSYTYFGIPLSWKYVY